MTTYQPPKKALDFPLFVGKTWTSGYTRSQYDDALGYINSSENPVYEVTEIETISVRAGTFKCYVIEESNIYGGGEKRFWYSPKVEKHVRIEDTYRITTTTELTFYSVEGQDEEEYASLLMLFLVFLIIITIVLILLTGRLRKVKRERTETAGARPFIPESQQRTTEITQQLERPPSESTRVPQFFCPTCSSPLSHIPQYNRWYCASCEKYI
jgi:hypothetical protein